MILDVECLILNESQEQEGKCGLPRKTFGHVVIRPGCDCRPTRPTYSEWHP